MRIFFQTLGTVLTVFIVLVALFVLGSFLPIQNGYTFRVVTSGSMEPIIHTGSVVVTIPRENYSIGDVVSFMGTKDNPMPTTHRLVGKSTEDGKETFTTKGDANNDADYRKITKNEILGKEFLTVPYVGYVASFTGTSRGWLLLIIFPVAVLFIWGFWDIVRSIKKKEKKKNVEGDMGEGISQNESS